MNYTNKQNEIFKIEGCEISADGNTVILSKKRTE
jgi:hypothetical protein